MDSLNLEIKSVSTAGTFEGYASVFGNEDLGGDVIDPGAFTKTLKSRASKPIFWEHEYMRDPTALPIGSEVEAAEDQNGLKVRGQINLGTKRGQEIFALMRQGAIKGLSIGYRAVKETWRGGIRYLQEVELGEWSIVTFPMNPLAIVTGTKAEDRAAAAIITTLQSMRQYVANHKGVYR